MSHPVDPGYPDSGSHASGGAYADTSTGHGGHDVSDVSVGQIMGNISQDLSTLVRQEIDLAKAETKVEAKKAGKAAGLLGAAGFAAYFLVLFASITLWQALASLFDESAWAALVVTALWGIAAAVLAVLGRKRMQEVNPKPERTVETLQEAPSALKPTNP